MKLSSTLAANAKPVVQRSAAVTSEPASEPQETFAKSNPSGATSFPASYFHKVGERIKEDGVMGTLMTAGMHGMLGGIGGQVCASMLSSFVPGPLGQALGAAGAVGGFVYGLQADGF